MNLFAFLIQLLVTAGITGWVQSSIVKVLTNGGKFEQYPIELTVNSEDNSWYEMEEIIEATE